MIFSNSKQQSQQQRTGQIIQSQQSQQQYPVQFQQGFYDTPIKVTQKTGRDFSPSLRGQGPTPIQHVVQTNPNVSPRTNPNVSVNPNVSLRTNPNVNVNVSHSSHSPTQTRQFGWGLIVPSDAQDDDLDMDDQIQEGSQISMGMSNTDIVSSSSYPTGAISDNIGTDCSVFTGTPIYSDDGLCHLIVQDDGNIVLYRTKIPFQETQKQGLKVLWASNTVGRGKSLRLTMQADGNLVAYSGKNPVWATASNKKGTSFRAVVQNNGVLEVYCDSKLTWSSLGRK